MTSPGSRVACTGHPGFERSRSEYETGSNWSLLSVMNGTAANPRRVIPVGTPQIRPLISSSVLLSEAQMRFRLREILSEAILLVDDCFLDPEVTAFGSRSIEQAPKVVNREDILPSN